MQAVFGWRLVRAAMKNSRGKSMVEGRFLRQPQKNPS
jgi:hypothetical protein